jgi:hypothetical protein
MDFIDNEKKSWLSQGIRIEGSASREDFLSGSRSQKLQEEKIRIMIRQFEEEIMSEPDRGIMLRFNDSVAQHFLLSSGLNSLSPILDYLQINPSSLKGDLGKAWLMLLNWIKINVDPSDREIRRISDLEKWKRWVKDVLSR